MCVCLRQGGGVWEWDMELVTDENASECTCFGVATQPFAENYNAPGMYVLRCFNGELYASNSTIPGGKERCVYYCCGSHGR